MNHIYFEFPFLHINNYQIMPSLIVFITMLVILAFWIDFYRHDKDIKIIKNRNISKVKFLVFSAYGMIFLLSYFFKAEKNLGDRANIIVKLANTYLNIELLVAFIMFFAFMYIFLVNKNKKAYFEFLKKPIVVLVYLSAFSYAVTHQIELGYNSNWIPYIGLVVFSILIFSVDIKDKIIENEQAEKRNQYNPIKNYDDLCKSHQGKADTLKNIIERNSDYGGISILVKGDWGIGKTSVVNGAIQKLKKDSKYQELRINALEIDSLESLFNYFFDFIRRCLKERGAYTGIASEYGEFVSSALGIVTTESFGNLFTKFFYSESKDYRGKKEELEKSIGNVLGKDKIIIVVDDIERCEKEKVKQFIFFIKEIATMDNCITIFISDEKALKECILKDNDNNRDMNDFLDKFFNYTVSVNTTDYEDILEDIEKQEKNIQSDLGFSKLKEVIESIVSGWEEKIYELNEEVNIIRINRVAEKKEEEIKTNGLENIKEAKNKFEDSLDNSRKLIKIYNLYLNYQKDLILNLKEFGNDKNNKKNQDYLDGINVSKIIFALAYIYVYFPKNIHIIEKRGIKEYLNSIKDVYNKDYDKVLLKELIEMDIDEEFDIYKYAYTSFKSNNRNDVNLYKREKFIKNLINGDEITPNDFTEMETFLLDYVEQEKWDTIIQEDKWFDILNLIIKKPVKIDSEEYKKHYKYIEYILNKLNESLEDGSLKWRYIFTGSKRIFNISEITHNNGNNIAIMKLVYEVFFEKSKGWEKNILFIESAIKEIYKYFIWNRLVVLFKLTLYIFYSKEDINEIKEVLSDIRSNNISEINILVDNFLSKLCTLLKIENLDKELKNKEYKEKFEKIIEIIKSKLEENEILYDKNENVFVDDVIEMLNKTEYLLKDLSYFIKISNLCDSKKNNPMKENISDKDFILKKIIDMKYREDLNITKEELYHLNKYVSECYEKNSNSNVIEYRQILSWHLDRITKSEEM